MKCFWVACMMALLAFIPTKGAAQPPYETFATGSFQPITVPGGQAVHTELLSLDLGYLEAGDLIFVDAFSILDKGTVGGDTILLVRSEIKQQVLFSLSTVDLEDRRYVPQNGRIQVWLHGIGQVKVSGNITLVMKSSSAGSDTTRYASQMRVYKFN